MNGNENIFNITNEKQDNIIGANQETPAKKRAKNL